MEPHAENEVQLTRCLLVTILTTCIFTTVSSYDITEPFDLTLILKLKSTDSGYTYPGDLTGEARGEPRELPARLDVGSNSQSYWYGKYTNPCCRTWTASGWIELDDERATSTKPLLDNNYRSGGNRPLAAIWALQAEEGELLSPKLPPRFSEARTDNVTDLVCLKILARVPEGARISVIAENTDKRGAMEIGEIVGNSNYEWTLSRIERTKKPIIQGRTARIKLLGKQQKGSINKVLVQWSTFCADEKELLDNYNGASIKKGDTEAHYSLLIPPGRFGTVRSFACLNGGSLDLDLGLCQCAPGFFGAVCEMNCGPNKYGVHCGGLCSKPFNDRQCRGVLMCSNRGCQCFAGYQGDACDEACPPGFYGSDCKEKCGACADSETCDRYSGQCENGCEYDQQPPFCHDKCGLPTDDTADPRATNNYFWHVGIYERKTKYYRRICSGSLIRPNYLLTAAWCVFSEETSSLKPASRFMSLFGTSRQHCFTDENYPEDVEIRAFASIHVPPLYRGSKRLHSDDIALIELERPVAQAPLVGPLCYESDHLKYSDESNQQKSNQILEGDIGYVVGWGLHEKDCNPNHLWKGYDVEYISQSSCLSQVTDAVLSFMDTQKFCSKDIDDDSENLVSRGDIGDIGSAFVYSKYDVLYIEGVKSGALANVNDSSITVYTKVSNYMEWIVSIWNKLDIQRAVKENI